MCSVAYNPEQKSMILTDFPNVLATPRQGPYASRKVIQCVDGSWGEDCATGEVESAAVARGRGG
jgi:hypothetical protein